MRESADPEARPHPIGRWRCQPIKGVIRVELLPLVILMGLLGSGAVPAETLDDAWRAAMAANHERSAAQRDTAAAALAVQAAERLRWPSVGMDAAYTQLNTTPAVRGSLPLIPGGPTQSFELPQQERGYASLRGVVSVPLFTGGQIPAAIEAAAATSRASQEDLRRTDLDLKLQVATAYVQALRAEKLLTVVLSAESGLSAHRTDVTRLLQQGIVARNDSLAVEVALADAQQRTLDARAQLDLARSAYNRLLDRQLDSAVELEDLEPVAATETLVQLTRVALEQRPELQTLTEQAAALRHEAERTQAAVRPQVAAQAGYAYQDNRYQVHEGLWSVGVGFRWAAFDGGVARAQSASLREQARALEDRVVDAQSRIAVEVHERHLELSTALERLAVASKALEQADENLRVTRNQYRAGTRTNTEVLDADTQRLRAHFNFYSARYDAVLSGWRLRRATGLLGVAPSAAAR